LLQSSGNDGLFWKCYLKNPIARNIKKAHRFPKSPPEAEERLVAAVESLHMELSKPWILSRTGPHALKCATAALHKLELNVPVHLGPIVAACLEGVLPAVTRHSTWTSSGSDGCVGSWRFFARHGFFNLFIFLLVFTRRQSLKNLVWGIMR
jgi:hypothetical protein